jgi:hypothetical protein
LEVDGGNRHDLPEAGGEIGKESAAYQREVGCGNLARADQPDEDGMQFDYAQGRNEMPGSFFCKEGVYSRSAQFHAVVLCYRAGIEETVGYPLPLLSLALLALGVNCLG